MHSARLMIRNVDLEIILLIQSKNKKGAELLYDSYAKMLFLSINRIVRDQVIAEVVFQAAFKKIWVSIDECVIKKASLRTWMISLAKTMAIETLSNRHIYGR